MDLDYILDVKLSFAKVLLSKAAQVENFNDLDELIDFVLTVIIERKYQLDSLKDDESSRLLYQINKMKNIREDYRKYIKQLNLKSINMYLSPNFDPYSFATRKVDDLFGYKTQDQIVEFFKSKYGEGVDIVQEDDYIISIKLPYGTNAKDTLPNSQLLMIASHINEYSIRVSKIVIKYIEQHRNRTVTYTAKHSGGHVGEVYYELNYEGKIRKHRCGLYNGLWRPNYFEG